MIKIENLQNHIDYLERFGATSFPFLNPEELEQIRHEIASYKLTEAVKKKGLGKVYQNFLEAKIYFDQSPLIENTARRLEEYLIHLFKQHPVDHAFIPDLCFNEARIQQYLPVGEFGIGPHKDGSRYRNVIAGLLVEGESCFYTCDDNKAANPELIPAEPGWCTILGAPGLFGLKSRRYHFVGVVKKTRTVIGFRQDVFSVLE